MFVLFNFVNINIYKTDKTRIMVIIRNDNKKKVKKTFTKKQRLQNKKSFKKNLKNF